MIKSEVQSKLKKIGTNEEKFKKYIRRIQTTTDGWYQLQKLLAVVKYTPKPLIENLEIKKILSAKFIKQITTKMAALEAKNKKAIASGWGNEYGDGNETPKAIKVLDNILSDADKIALAKYLVPRLYLFYSYSRKEVIDFVVDWIDKDLAIKLVDDCHRIMSLENMEKIKDLLPQGYIDKYATRSAASIMNKYSKIDLTKDLKARAEFIKIVARRPSIMKRANFNLNINLEDLKKLPSITRLNLMRTLFEPLIRAIIYNKNDYAAVATILQLPNKNDKKWMGNISVSSISIDEMKDLLFAASMKNNEEVRKFFEGYQIYKDRSQNLSHIFNRMGSWFLKE